MKRNKLYAIYYLIGEFRYNLCREISMSNGNDDIRIIVATCPETLGKFSNYCSKLELQLALSPKEFIDKNRH